MKGERVYRGVHQEAPDADDEAEGREGEEDERAAPGDEDPQALRLGAELYGRG